MNFQTFAHREGAEAVTRLIGLSEQPSASVIHRNIKGRKRTRAEGKKLLTPHKGNFVIAQERTGETLALLLPEVFKGRAGSHFAVLRLGNSIKYFFKGRF